MVATLTPLQWNPSFLYKQHLQHHPNVHFYSKPQLRSNCVRLQIAVKYKQSTCFDADVRSDLNHAQILKSSFNKILTKIKKTVDCLVLLGLLLFYDHKRALAASGGRIGGSAFSSRSKSSSSSSKTFSKSSSSSPSSYSFSTRSPKSATSFKGTSRPRKSVKSSWYSTLNFWGTVPSSRDSAPLQEPALGSWSSTSSSRDSAPLQEPALSSWTSTSSSEFWAPPPRLISESTLSLIIIGFSVLAAFDYVLEIFSKRSRYDILTNSHKTSVFKLQVGLLGSARTLQKDFNRLAETTDTSTPKGLSYVLTEATLALLRHPDYCISCYSSVDVKQCIEEGEKKFNQLSIEERGKFDEETLVNVNSIKIQSSKIHRASGLNNEYIVVTILVAAEGVLKLETIKRIGDLKEALQKLGSIPSNKILAVEVMWTPQNEKDVLSERELLEDYPHLRSF